MPDGREYSEVKSHGGCLTDCGSLVHNICSLLPALRVIADARQQSNRVPDVHKQIDSGGS